MCMCFVYVCGGLVRFWKKNGCPSQDLFTCSEHFHVVWPKKVS